MDLTADYLERCRRVEDALRDANADQIRHGSHTLLAHLTNTRRLLEGWSCPPPVCLAGLCHSAYGLIVSPGQVGRAALDDLIGPDAAHLVDVIACTSVEEIETRLLAHPGSACAETLAGAATVIAASDIEALGRSPLSWRSLERRRHLASILLDRLPTPAQRNLIGVYRLTDDATPERMAHAVADAYIADAEAHHALRARQSDDVQLLAILEYVLEQGACVLDLGCGSGSPVMERLLRRFRVVGLDISRPQLALARRGGGMPTNLICADMLHVPLRAGSCDAVCCYYALVHYPRARHDLVIPVIYDVLKPGGWALLCLGATDVAAREVHDLLPAPVWFSHYDAAENEQMIRDHGFEIHWSQVVGEGTAAFLFALARRPSADDNA